MEHGLLTLAWQWLINCVLIETESLSDDSIQLHAKWIQCSKHYCCDENLCGIDLWTDLKGFIGFISGSGRSASGEQAEVAMLPAKQILLFSFTLNSSNCCPLCSLSRTYVRWINLLWRAEKWKWGKWKECFELCNLNGWNVEFLSSYGLNSHKIFLKFDWNINTLQRKTNLKNKRKISALN